MRFREAVSRSSRQRAGTATGRTALRIVRLRRRARIYDGDDVLSEILDHPGPTSTLFDVLAACVAALSPGPRVAMLGFAGGGVIAPMRAMGFDARIEGVDLDARGHALFKEMSDGWAGWVDVHQDDAARWLTRRNKPYDLILEDLSTPATEDEEGIKPDISLEVLPALMKQRLSPRGVAITNVLPMPGYTWALLLEKLAAPFPEALVVVLDDYMNKILIAGRDLESPRRVSNRLRTALRGISSKQAETLSVRRLVRVVAPTASGR